MINLTATLYPQPTLALYLGGTGILVGEQLMSMREELDADVAAFIEPYFIDSQEPKIVDHERSRHFCYTDLDQFFQPIYSQFTNTRFPDNLGVEPVFNSSEGCGVTRIFGSASLAASLDDFVLLVEQAMSRLKARRRTDKQPLQVFITASACGGTGAGMILDAAALVRHFCRAKGENPRIFLFLMGPSVFFEDPNVTLDSEKRDRMRASTYALFKELHHFAKGEPFISSYRLRDETLQIGNVTDADRLFEWVYLIDGTAEKGGMTRTVDEVIWMIAEMQMHLALSEVGRQVAQSMPNQREQRGREYALHYVHPDNKARMSEDTRRGLQIAGRKTFLASFALRNVRFPAQDIKQWFRAGWVRDALRKALRREDPTPQIALIDQLDATLGVEGGHLLPDGLLAQLGLMAEQLLSRIAEDADPERGIPKAPPRAATPDNALAAAQKLAEAAEWIRKDLENDTSLLAQRPAGDGGRLIAASELVERAMPRWTELWREGLDREGKLTERLLSVAWARANGRGLEFLNDLLNRAIDVLLTLASQAQKRPGISTLEEAVAELDAQIASVRTTRDRERRGYAYHLRSFIARRFFQTQYETDKLLTRTRPLIQAAITLRQLLVEHRGAHLAASLAPRAWLLAADELRRWRDSVLSPTIIAAENALTIAENEYERAHHALSTCQGENERGDWTSHTTVQIADDELLAALSAHVHDVKVEDVVLVPLQQQGISRESERLNIHSLRTIDHATTVKMLTWHVEQATQGKLAFLDNGWKLDEVKSRLRSRAAPVLDSGSEPLVNFSRDAVGVSLQSYLLVPDEIILPKPFGRRAGQMNRLQSNDPLQLSVASFVYGIPPNALGAMRELFEQYTLHVGDQARYREVRDRYPMHIFREAAETYDEPYSPLAYEATGDFMDVVIVAAQELWGSNGGVHLDIRELDLANTIHRDDWNRCVELTEKVLRWLVRSPAEAARIFTHPRFRDLQRLYDSRMHRAAPPAAKGGTQGGPASWFKERPQGEA